jgi:hypothetical protein
MSRADSVTTEIRRLYEENVRESLPRILRNAFGTRCRQPEGGYQRIFNRPDNVGNLWWVKKSDDNQVEIDFLAHVVPLSILPDVNESKVSENPNAQVFKSPSQVFTSAIVGAEAARDFQQTKSESPEKADAPLDIDADGSDGGGDDNFQYIIAEITCGGSDTVLKKLEQLEKDCYFLCSRACPSLTDEKDFQVLNTLAFVAVISPVLNANELRKRIFKSTKPLPLLQELFNQGRFVWIEHKKTIVVVIQQLGNKLDSVMENVSEQNEATQAMKAQLSEQIEATQAMKAQVSEQNEATQAMKAQVSEQNEATQAMKLQLSEQNQTIKALESKLSEQSEAMFEIRKMLRDLSRAK